MDALRTWRPEMVARLRLKPSISARTCKTRLECAKERVNLLQQYKEELYNWLVMGDESHVFVSEVLPSGSCEFIVNPNDPRLCEADDRLGGGATTKKAKYQWFSLISPLVGPVAFVWVTPSPPNPDGGTRPVYYTVSHVACVVHAWSHKGLATANSTGTECTAPHFPSGSCGRVEASHTTRCPHGPLGVSAPQ